MSALVVKSTEAGVLTVRMNRPEKKNALTADMYQALADALDEAAQTPSIRATLILGVPGALLWMLASGTLYFAAVAAWERRRDANGAPVGDT